MKVPTLVPFFCNPLGLSPSQDLSVSPSSSDSLSMVRVGFLLRVLLAGPSSAPEAESSSSLEDSSSDVMSTLLFDGLRRCGFLRVIATPVGPFPATRGCPLKSVVPLKNTRSLSALVDPEGGGA
jgi:hypothetical protein